MRFLSALLSVAVVCLSACSSAPGAPAGRGASAPTLDFSGAWEVDYSKSETVHDSYEAMMRELRRQIERRQAMNQGRGGLSTGVPIAAGGDDIYALARLAELVTDIQLMDIEQGAQAITIKREGSFALYCEFDGAELYTQRNPMGSEVCGWDGHQLVFQIFLPEGISIFHRFTLGPSAERINVATTVASDRVSYPFTLDRVFNRYDPNSSGIRCRQTLTRGRICTTEAPEL
jgi:hypothetical protein